MIFFLIIIILTFFQTEEVAEEMDKTANLTKFPDSLTTAPPQPITTTTTSSVATTPKPAPIPPRPPIGPFNLNRLFTGSVFGLPRNNGRFMGLGRSFFFVKPVGPRPTRTPVVV